MEEQSLTLLISIGILIMLIMSGAVLFFTIYSRKKILEKELEKVKAEEEHVRKQNELRIKVSVESREEEKEDISRFIHDDINMRLSHVESQLRKIGSDVFSAKNPKFEKQLVIVNEVRNELRDMSHQLLPSALKLGLFNGLRDLETSFNEAHDMKLNIDIMDLDPITTESGKAIYRICQELLHNAVKHSGADSVEIMMLPEEDDNIFMTYYDNGKGIEEDHKPGNGLINIESYVGYLGGQFDLLNINRGGFEITFTFPKNQFYENN